MHALPPRYVQAEIDGALAIVRDDVVGFVRQAVMAHGTLYDFGARHPEAQTLQGRGPLYVVPGAGRDRWVIRHLRHGGLLAPLTRDRFLRSRRPRPFNELRVAAHLRSLAIPTPEVTAAIVYPSAALYRGDVARLEVPGARDLAECLFGDPPLDAAERIVALGAAGRLLRWLHTRGVIHPDLNLRNVLIEWAGRPPRPYILDLEKCRIVARVPTRRRRQMLARIRRSARRFEARTGRHITDEEWHAFHTAYAEVRHEEE